MTFTGQYNTVIYTLDNLTLCVQNDMFYVSVCVQNDRYTVGGSEMFDTLTDLVEHYKRKGIEEISGNWVFLKQVNWIFFTNDQLIWIIIQFYILVQHVDCH